MSRAHHLIAQEMRPKVERGVDHGTTGRILVRYGDRRLVWQGGCTTWAGVGVDTYFAAYLEVDGLRHWGIGHTIHSGGRLSKPLIAKHIEKIRELLELPDLRAEDINTTRTRVVE